MKKIAFALFTCTALLSCNDDRKNDDSFESMDEFFDEHKVEEQEFIINSEDSTGHITGNQGTELYVSKKLFQDPTSKNEVSFPYIIKLVELYKYKDMILWKMPSPHDNGPLNNGGDIRVKAFKDQQELELKPLHFYRSRFSSIVTETAMEAFQAKVSSSDEFESWNLASDGSTVVVDSDKYQYDSYRMGWISPAKNRAVNATTNVEFDVQGSGGDNISLAICFTDFHCVLTGSNLKIKNVPVGENAVVIAMAKDQNGIYRLHQETIVTSNSTKIDLNMEKVDEATLLAALEAL